jgi:cobaltochelatase CobN
MFAQTIATPTFRRVEKSNLYRRLGVPLIKAILSLTPYTEWEENPQGLGPLDVVMSVALPEFDGALITVPVATREELERDTLTGATLIKYVPIGDRVRKVASLALRWAALRRKPNADKKIAIILHNYPPRNDRIGNAFGLDTPASIYKLLAAMREAGYRVDDLPEDGEALMQKILAGLTNERGWLEPRELGRRAAARVEKKTYKEWFSAFPAQIQEHLQRDWGDPPGRIFSYGEDLLIPGIFLGNVFWAYSRCVVFLRNLLRYITVPILRLPTTIWRITAGCGMFSRQTLYFISANTGPWNGYPAKVSVFRKPVFQTLLLLIFRMSTRTLSIIRAKVRRLNAVLRHVLLTT